VLIVVVGYRGRERELAKKVDGGKGWEERKRVDGEEVEE
jgi:hypothetical protein